MIVLGESNFEFRFRSIIQFFHFFIHRSQLAEPKTALAKYDQYFLSVKRNIYSDKF